MDWMGRKETAPYDAGSKHQKTLSAGSPDAEFLVLQPWRVPVPLLGGQGSWVAMPLALRQGC